MGNHCGNVLNLSMFRFNLNFWVQIFRMRNFLDVYFHCLNLQKFKQFVFCQFFKKSPRFWLKFSFAEYFNWINFRKISLILFFFVKVYLAKNLKLSICKSLSRKVFLISLFQFFLS